jgi:hypothetical protein
MKVMNSAAIPEPHRIALPRARVRAAGLHAGIDPALSGLIAVLLLPAFYAIGMETALALPLAVLLGLTGQRFLDVLLHAEKRDVFAPAVLIAFYFTLYFGLRTIYLHTARFVDSRIGLNTYDDYLPQALWCAALGYVCFSLGFSSKFERSVERALPRVRLSWPRKVPGPRILIVLAVGFACVMYLLSIGVVVGEYNNLEFLSHPPPGLPILLEKLLYLGWVAICICLLSRHTTAGRRDVWPLFAASVGFLFARVAITGSKEALIEPILQAVIVFHYLKRRLKPWQLATVALPAILVAFGAVNFYRFVIIGELGGAPKDLGDVVSRVSSASDYLSSGKGGSGQLSAIDQMMLREAGVDALALVMKYTPHPFPFAYGRDLLGVPLSFVPRQMWKDKPIVSEGRDFELQYMGMPSDFLGFSSMHLISDLYRNYYFFGVAAGMFLIGSALRLAYRFTAPASGNGAGVFLYAALFPIMGRFLEGAMATELEDITRTCLLVVAAGLFLGLRFRKPDSSKLKSLTRDLPAGRRGRVSDAEWNDPRVGTLRAY